MSIAEVLVKYCDYFTFSTNNNGTAASSFGFSSRLRPLTSNNLAVCPSAAHDLAVMGVSIDILLNAFYFSLLILSRKCLRGYLNLALIDVVWRRSRSETSFLLSYSIWSLGFDSACNRPSSERPQCPLQSYLGPRKGGRLASILMVYIHHRQFGNTCC